MTRFDREHHFQPLLRRINYNIRTFSNYRKSIATGEQKIISNAKSAVVTFEYATYCSSVTLPLFTSIVLSLFLISLIWKGPTCANRWTLLLVFMLYLLLYLLYHPLYRCVLRRCLGCVIFVIMKFYNFLYVLLSCRTISGYVDFQYFQITFQIFLCNFAGVGFPFFAFRLLL